MSSKKSIRRENVRSLAEMGGLFRVTKLLDNGVSLVFVFGLDYH